MAKTAKPKSTKPQKQEPLEKQLWKAADKLRKNIDAAEYKHVVLGLIFLKYISDAFEELHQKLLKGEGEYAGADPEDRDEYRAENVFFVQPSAQLSYIQFRVKWSEFGKHIDSARGTVETIRSSLCGVLLKVHARRSLDLACDSLKIVKFKRYDKIHYIHCHIHTCTTPAWGHALVNLDQ